MNTVVSVFIEISVPQVSKSSFWGSLLYFYFIEDAKLQEWWYGEYKVKCEGDEGFMTLWDIDLLPSKADYTSGRCIY